jgi:hypothetical protein
MSTGWPIALALTEYLLLSKRTRQVFDTEAGTPAHIFGADAFLPMVVGFF